MPAAAAATPKRATRIPKAVMARKLAALERRGLTQEQRAKAVSRSVRYVRDVEHWARSDGEAVVIEIPEPKDRSKLSPEALECLEFTADGFEKFFNRHSNRWLPSHGKRWVTDILRERRVLINTPPRHAKSTIVTVWFVLWLITLDRNVQVLIVSQTNKLATKFTNEIAWHLSYNEKLIADFGRYRPELTDWPWRPNQGELLVDGRTRETKSGDLTLQVRGAGQQILGMEANWVIADDPVSRRTAESETERERMSEWFHGDVLSRLEPGGHAVVIGQRLHLRDLYGELAEKRLTRVEGGPPVWNTIVYPAVLDWDTQEVLWPEKWTFDELMVTYESIGSTMFETMFQQNPLPDGMRLVSELWIQGDETHPGCLDYDRGIGQGYRQIEDSFLPVVRVLSIDPSPTKFWGWSLMDTVYTGQVFAASILFVKSEVMGMREAMEEIQWIVKEFGVDYTIIEKNSAHMFMQQPEFLDLRFQTKLLPHTTSASSKDHATLGVSSLAVDFEWGRIRFPFGDAEARSNSQIALNEILSYPQGATDDVLMSLWFPKYNFQRLVPSDRMATSFDESGEGSAPGWDSF